MIVLSFNNVNSKILKIYHISDYGYNKENLS
jgi:hypothetical protein